MKKMINKVEEVVKQQLQGFSIAHKDLEVSLDPMFIVRKNKAHSKVAIISGGGSGHEPMHGGFVGQGMLDGACPGEMFTSPTPDQMFECGLKAHSGKGVLFLVKNYTGDVLNFETSLELLSAEGIEVQTALIDDDVAVKDSLYTAGRRGVATTVLAEKILGAAAESAYTLEQLSVLAKKIANQGRSFGVGLKACTVPAAGKPSFTLEDNEVEFGVGIHGEPGIERRPFDTCDALTEDMMSEILDNTPYVREVRLWDNTTHDWKSETWTTEPLLQGDKAIVLINNLGATPESELYIVFRKVAEILEEKGISVERSLIGSYCTSLDMQGVSITVLNADEEMLGLFDRPVKTPSLRWDC
ncbi:dihydroxyacetone kinase subunit DhaK [Agarivorans sp. TSD2052]|uniref:dihydroxyacetone kinase subunit DhaK n=1 Tax=Agarivorans sp. TSD2052 TaxID=2937286 RepID=UPI0020109E98|nr:dihydroxyacetone kinase subunit DhaK [Agarivorans sp. TSD2052]UPW18074.1 dihydroxyacetone kinase subunit DhaK [Agarivorans sp. TSD2052]